MLIVAYAEYFNYVIMLNTIMLHVVLKSVILLSVMAPYEASTKSLQA